MDANDMDSEMIRQGETLIIPSLPAETATERKRAQPKTYEVRRGDTLSEIAIRMDVEQKQLEQLNYLENSSIRIGKELLIPGVAGAGEYYQVEPGDSLSRISLLFDISVDQLKLINGFDGDALQVGKELLVGALRPQIHEVVRGDSLWDIAAAYELAIEDLKKWNGLSDGDIHPGQELQLYERTIENFDANDEEPDVLMARVPVKHPPLEEYANYREKKDYQPSMGYSEDRLENPAENYRQAKELLSAFDLSISREPRLSNQLAGYSIVIDPGHGGLDPGAIVPSKNGNGETVYVVEDEYAYDISLRTYRLLKLHGADVTLTVISPNHQIRSSEDPSKTFINMKNEVYNLASLNRKGDGASWPVGNARGLRKRVEVAEAAFRGADEDKTLFLSIHADNSPDHGQGTMVLYSSENEENIEESKELAESLVPFLGASSFTKRQNLSVLRDNPAYAEVLIEIRNIHYPGNSWAIRYDRLRQQDAQFIADGILNYAEMRN